MGFGVWGLGFGVWGLGFGVWGLGFRVEEFQAADDMVMWLAYTLTHCETPWWLVCIRKHSARLPGLVATAHLAASVTASHKQPGKSKATPVNQGQCWCYG